MSYNRQYKHGQYVYNNSNYDYSHSSYNQLSDYGFCVYIDGCNTSVYQSGPQLPRESDEDSDPYFLYYLRSLEPPHLDDTWFDRRYILQLVVFRLMLRLKDDILPII